jgi:hypothetical protein
MIAELVIDRDDADHLLTHMAQEHGIPVSIAQRIPTPALRKLCADDQAQDLEDWRR